MHGRRSPLWQRIAAAFGFGVTGIIMAEKIGYYTKLHRGRVYNLLCGNSLPLSDLLCEKNMRTVGLFGYDFNDKNLAKRK